MAHTYPHTQITLPVNRQEYDFLLALTAREQETSLPNLIRTALLNVAEESGVEVPEGVLRERRAYRPSPNPAWRGTLVEVQA